MMFAVRAAAFWQTSFWIGLQQWRKNSGEEKSDQRPGERSALDYRIHCIFSTRIAPLYSQAANTEPSARDTSVG